jgi:DNA-binding transcriptional MerR regulator
MRELERATAVGRETIRYYIREGLLPEPERLGRNVALYDEAFVERIRLIKTLQRTRFLPLQVIKAVLDSGSAPSAAQTDALMELDGRVFAPAHTAEAETVAAVLERTALPAGDLEALAEAGVIESASTDGGRQLAREDTEIVERWAAMRAAGFSNELGFTPLNLRVHAGMIEVLVEEELRMFTERIADRVGRETSVQMAEAGIEEVGHILALMRRKRILRAFAEAGASRARRPKKSKAR